MSLDELLSHCDERTNCVGRRLCCLSVCSCPDWLWRSDSVDRIVRASASFLTPETVDGLDGLDAYSGNFLTKQN